MSCGGGEVEGASGGATPEQSSEVCRDFLRNICRRGRRCKFPHPACDQTEPSSSSCVDPASPASIGSAVSLSLLDGLSFCHDYQNGHCARVNCRFVHCSTGEEKRFRSSGELSVTALEDVIARGAELRLNRHDPPVCKNFVRGECLRAAKCRYRHVTGKDLAEFVSRCLASSSASCRSAFAANESSASPDDSFAASSHHPVSPRGLYEFPSAKRPHLDVQSNRSGSARLGYNSSCASASPTISTTLKKFTEEHELRPLTASASSVSLVDFRLMEDNNRMLQRQVQELRKQVEHLTTANEFLLDQNAQLRYSKNQHQQHQHNQQQQAAVAAAGVTTVTVPAAAPLTMSPISQALAAGQTAQVMTVPGSLTAVPVTLAARHARQPSTAPTVAVSLASVSLTQPVAVASISSIQAAAAAAAQSSIPLSSIQAVQAQPSLSSIAVGSLPSIEAAGVAQPAISSIQVSAEWLPECE